MIYGWLSVLFRKYVDSLLVPVGAVDGVPGARRRPVPQRPARPVARRLPACPAAANELIVPCCRSPEQLFAFAPPTIIAIVLLSLTTRMVVWSTYSNICIISNFDR